MVVKDGRQLYWIELGCKLTTNLQTIIYQNQVLMKKDSMERCMSIGCYAMLRALNAADIFKDNDMKKFGSLQDKMSIPTKNFALYFTSDESHIVEIMGIGLISLK